MRVLLKILCAAMLVSACAHKAPPLFKDRMKPKLIKARALNNRQVQLSFSENIDTLDFNDPSIAIFSDSDTLDITALYPSLSAAEIICLTAPQLPVRYRITGIVYDTAQNIGAIDSWFEGSTMPDTVAPYVVQYSSGARTHEFMLFFSEAMDTSRLSYHVLPVAATKAQWQNLRTCRITPRDPNMMLAFDTTYYLFINREAYDVSGNALEPFITSITPDSGYKPFTLKGAIHTEDSLLCDGIAVLSRFSPQAVAFIRNRQVTFEVRDQDAYTMEAVCNGSYGAAMVWADSVNTITVTPGGITIDSIIP